LRLFYPLASTVICTLIHSYDFAIDKCGDVVGQPAHGAGQLLGNAACRFALCASIARLIRLKTNFLTFAKNRDRP